MGGEGGGGGGGGGCGGCACLKANKTFQRIVVLLNRKIKPLFFLLFLQCRVTFGALWICSVLGLITSLIVLIV